MRLDEVFDIKYGHSLALNHLELASDSSEGIAFVSRTSRNNGVSAWVKEVRGLEPIEPGALTVCLRSRNYALSTFVQPYPFYTGYHVHVLTPKSDMSLAEKLWWATCIEANRFRYNFGRQANRSLATLDVPDIVPDWVGTKNISPLGQVSSDATRQTNLSGVAWASFRIGSLFAVHSGRSVLRRDMTPGATAYVSASERNNGVTAWIGSPASFQGGQITVSTNGSIGEAFYQPMPFVASADVAVLVPKRKLSVSQALFICTMIRAEKYRWNYGRKWGVSRLQQSSIWLPVDKAGRIHWSIMSKLVGEIPVFD